MSARVPAHPPGAQPASNSALFLALAVVVVAGGLWSLAVFAIPAILPAMCGIAIALLAAAIAFACYYRQKERHLKRWSETTHAELVRLATDTLPTAVRKLRSGKPAEVTLAETPQPTSEIHRGILQMLAFEIGIGERQRAAAMAACANAAGRVQAMATSMLADLREMEDRHSEETLGDLLKLDHNTAQVGRLADSIAVLAGARSGRRWTKPIVMQSILRGAMGRIGAYQRVRVHSTSTAAIAGYAAEDIMHALAELMDNATKFSAPSEEVHVYVEEVHSGIVITIEDAGLGMKPRALERARVAVSSSEPLDLTKLSGTRLGLAVVGSLARKHRLEVFFRPSSRGGIGAVLRIPGQLITQSRDEPPAAATQPAIALPVAAAKAGAAQPEVTATAVLDGEKLPKRRKGETLAATQAANAGKPKQQPRPRTDAGARFGAFRQATRPTPAKETEKGEET
ncbi:ATP-binding protein [Amycolatopsis pigmentata]|uniref:histidine kinase n=1 Tax=Amycolatopsis pigmentata TaxID=450801 RepID=A0ABW5FY03_9PSEU